MVTLKGSTICFSLLVAQCEEKCTKEGRARVKTVGIQILTSSGQFQCLRLLNGLVFQWYKSWTIGRIYHNYLVHAYLFACYNISMVGPCV